MRVFAVSGYSGTGKTNLVEVIVSTLVERGYSVATIKSGKHEAGPEEGTDTWKHTQAGASATIYLKASNVSEKLRDRISDNDLTQLSKHDFLIIEGMKSVDIPRFWCIGDANLNPDDIPENTQAIVTLSEKQNVISNIPILTTDNIGKIVDIVEIKSVDISEVD
ncbi:MAG: molybdopterin-guanine dinucleotide biosynthesis protein B [Candidatus Thorarchaeota archaeon]